MTHPGNLATAQAQRLLTLNGQPHAFAPGDTVALLLERLGYAEKRVALELNGAILPKSLHLSTALAGGDQLEIVQAIGGG